MGEKRQKLSCLYDACPKLLLLTIKNYHKYSVFMSEFRSRARRAERSHEGALAPVDDSVGGGARPNLLRHEQQNDDNIDSGDGYKINCG